MRCFQVGEGWAFWGSWLLLSGALGLILVHLPHFWSLGKDWNTGVQTSELACELVTRCVSCLWVFAWGCPQDCYRGSEMNLSLEFPLPRGRCWQQLTTRARKGTG